MTILFRGSSVTVPWSYYEERHNRSVVAVLMEEGRVILSVTPTKEGLVIVHAPAKEA